MIQDCRYNESEIICQIVNDAAQAYKLAIPQDCWTEPYIPQSDLNDEIDAGVRFLGYEQDGQLVGVMGVQ